MFAAEDVRSRAQSEREMGQDQSPEQLDNAAASIASYGPQRLELEGVAHFRTRTDTAQM